MYLVQVKKCDDLPEALCSDCHAKLLSSNNFREQCISSEICLQHILVQHKECVQIKNGSDEDELGNFESFFEMDYMVRNIALLSRTPLVFFFVFSLKDQNEVDTTDADFTNGKVEAFEISTTEIINTTKRKRGRPRTRVVEIPPPVKQDRRKGKRKERSSARKKKKSVRKDFCLICRKVVNFNMKGHLAIHDKTETFMCDICGFQTNVKLYLQNHMKKRHIAERHAERTIDLTHDGIETNSYFSLQTVPMS